MVSQEILNITAPFLGSFVNAYGFSAEVFLAIFACLIALVISLAIGIKANNSQVGIPVFFGVLAIFAVLGIITWFLVVVPLVFVVVVFVSFKGGQQP